jgi:predicted transcriptional regulator of viral defense system
VNLDLFHSPELVAFTTRDYARLAGISIAAASKRLVRLQRDNSSLMQLSRGIWANTAHPHFNALVCVPVLLGSEQGCISFLSALHIHGALSQIPATVQVASTGHSRTLRTPIGVFEFLQLKPEMFAAGIEWSDSLPPYRVATIEKALIDTFYIATRKRRRFARLPELELDDAGFSKRRYRELLKSLKLPSPIAVAVESRLGALKGE